MVASIYPRRAPESSGDDRHLFYFGQVRNYESTSSLKTALVTAAVDPLDRNAHQLFHVSRIVGTKYALIRASIWLLLIAAALWLLAGVRGI